jgi:hypothetical protein
MIEANLNGSQTKNCVNCIDLEAIIDECVIEQKENKTTVSKGNDINTFRLKTESRSLKKLLNKGKLNNKHMNELKTIKYVKSQVHYRNFGTH